jgi:hypothetical protein
MATARVQYAVVCRVGVVAKAESERRGEEQTKGEREREEKEEGGYTARDRMLKQEGVEERGELLIHLDHYIRVDEPHKKGVSA